MANGAVERARELNLAVVALYRQGRFVEARSAAEEALRFAREELDPGHPELGSALNNLAVHHRAVGNYRAAEPLLQEALLGP